MQLSAAANSPKVVARTAGRFLHEAADGVSEEPSLINAGAGRPKRKRSKVRSAWISFIGRIIAQVVGAIASVTLGLIVLTKYKLPERLATKPAMAQADGAHDAARKARRATGEVALAVLPVQNYSPDAAQVVFADGVTEALTSEIAQIAGLRVTSRTSAMAYKGSTKSLREIARELDVDLILEGSLVREQELVRVTAQLIDAERDQHLWARSYDRSIRSLLPVQAEMAKSIVKDLNAALARRKLPPLP
jgi:TolB-like protein